MTGHVYDAETGEPMIGCEIIICGYDGEYVDKVDADIHGEWKYCGPSEEHLLITAHYLGYESMTRYVMLNEKNVNLPLRPVVK